MTQRLNSVRDAVINSQRETFYNFLVKKHAERCITCKSASVATDTSGGKDVDELTAARAMFTMF